MNILFLWGYIFGVAIPLGLVAKTFKCRSTAKLALVSVAVGLMGLYFVWVFFIKALYGANVDLISLILSPGLVWDVACDTCDKGWWDGGPSGIFGWIVASIEAAVLVFGPAYIVTGQIADEVFCESCMTWCEQTGCKSLKITPLLKPDSDSSASVDGQAGKDTGGGADSPAFASDKIDPEHDNYCLPGHIELLKLPETDASEFPRVDATVLTCTGCRCTNAIRFDVISRAMDKDGALVQETTMIPGILLKTSTPDPGDDFAPVVSV